MMDAEELRDRLAEIAEKTMGADAINPFACWVGDAAEERRIGDDIGSGRGAWVTARRTARLGLEALDAGNIEGAKEFLLIATDFYIDALESRIEPRDIAFLSNSAQRRGRRKKNQERN